MKIYFPNADKVTNIKELLELGFSYAKFQKTFTDKEFTKEQCHVARRSFTDLLYICQTYFPNTTKEELAHLLITTPKMRCFICPDINKLVFIAESSPYKFLQHNKYTSDYIGMDELSFNMVEEYANNYKPII